MSSMLRRVMLAGLLTITLGMVSAGPVAAADPVTLKVRDENGNGVPGGVATPACGGTWQATLPGVTDASGDLVATLPDCTTKVRMEVNQGSVEQTTAEMTASNYTWTTQILRIYLKDHTAAPITDQAGLLQEGGGYWYSWGNFNAFGYKDIPLFARASAYKFKVTYNFTSQEKFPVVSTGVGIQEFDFQTGQVIGTCITQYASGGWQTFTSGMELMPGTYTFKNPSQSGTVTAGGITTLTGCTTNAPPTVDAGGPYDVDEGGSVMVSATGFDPDGDTLTYAWDLDNNGSFETSGQFASFSAAAIDGPSTWTIRVQVTDTGGTSATDTATVNVLNVAPTLTSVAGSASPVAVNVSTSIMLAFTDPAGSNDNPYAVEVDWGDGAGFGAAGTLSHPGGLISHTYTATGVYTVCAKVTDSDDGVSNELCFQYVIVYDPSAGFVTGGGWITSPAGAYLADPSMTGKATFGFVSKYKKGATVPEGNTQFQFHAAGLNFQSTVYQWLVVSGAQKAQYKGTGTINGAGDYGFLVTLYDGGSSGDKFRIKIWDKANSDLVYDSGLGAAETLEDGLTPIGGGSIMIHVPKK